MTVPKIYVDACCLIEALKGRTGRDLDHAKDADMTERALRAARDGALKLYTSTISVAEVTHLGEKPPSDDDKLLIERLLLSGRDGVITVEANPLIVARARDFIWNDGLGGQSIDRIHVASALHVGAAELFTVDGRLAKKFPSVIEGCSLISASDSKLVPPEYLTGDLFRD